MSLDRSLEVPTIPASRGPPSRTTFSVTSTGSILIWKVNDVALIIGRKTLHATSKNWNAEEALTEGSADVDVLGWRFGFGSQLTYNVYSTNGCEQCSRMQREGADKINNTNKFICLTWKCIFIEFESGSSKHQKFNLRKPDSQAILRRHRANYRTCFLLF